MHLLFKKQFETCLDCINRYKAEHPEVGALTYAGRLDPLASGLLIALQAEETELKKDVLNMPKSYAFDIVFGVGTDSFDQLGMVFPSEDILTWKTLNFDKEKIKSIQNNLKNEFRKKENADIASINKNLAQIVGKAELYYPFFSSKTIDGIPLFEYTKTHGMTKTNEVLPKHEVEIFNLTCKKVSLEPKKDLIDESIQIAQKVSGDFRQSEIINSWRNTAITEHDTYVVWSCEMTVSSGFYIRSFAVWLGQMMGESSLARNIVRTAVGEYTLKNILHK